VFGGRKDKEEGVAAFTVEDGENGDDRALPVIKNGEEYKEVWRGGLERGVALP
jgi:hypothetical protein